MTSSPPTRRRLRAALEAAGVVFNTENGGGAGVRLKSWEDEGGVTGEEDIS